MFFGDLKAFREPLYQGSAFPWMLALLIIGAGLFNVSRVFWSPITHETPIDFRPLYLGQRVLVEEGNPYRLSEIKAAWERTGHEEGFEPGGRQLALFYPPWAVCLFLLFNPVTYLVSFVLWYCLIPILLALAAWFALSCYQNEVKPALFVDLVLLVLAFKGTVQAVIVGQPVFLCLFLNFVALASASKGKWVLAGVMLAVGSFKVSLAIPFVVLFVFKRHWKSLGVACCMGALLLLVYVLVSADPLGQFSRFLVLLGIANSYHFEPTSPNYPLTYGMTTLTELGTVFEFLFSGALRFLPWIYLTVASAFVLRLFWLNRRLALREDYLLVCLSLLTLLTTHHLFYDILILLPVYGLARLLDGRYKATLLLLSVFLFIPVNGILSRLPDVGSLHVLYFTLPLTMLAFSLFMLSSPVAEKMNPRRPEASNH